MDEARPTPGRNHGSAASRSCSRSPDACPPTSVRRPPEARFDRTSNAADARSRYAPGAHARLDSVRPPARRVGGASAACRPCWPFLKVGRERLRYCDVAALVPTKRATPTLLANGSFDLSLRPRPFDQVRPGPRMRLVEGAAAVDPDVLARDEVGARPEEEEECADKSSGACSLAKIRCAASVGAMSGCRLS